MTDCILQQLDNGKWWCPECDPKKTRLLSVKARRNCKTPANLAERIRWTIAQRSDVTRSPEDLERIITICTTQCPVFGTLYIGDNRYARETCPYHGRPCNGAFEKWMHALADGRTWCNHWGPEEGVFHELGTTDTDP